MYGVQLNMIKRTYQNGGSNPPMKSTVTDNSFQAIINNRVYLYVISNYQN